MKYTLLTLLLICCGWATATAQQNLTAQIIDETGKPLKYATVSLLSHSDSTLQFFGISTESGQVSIKAVKPGSYLLQSAMLGRKTFYRTVTTPMSNGGDLGAIIMDKAGVNMKQVEVVGEKIPMLINNDTLDYNASAFKTKADANVEELLKKLPGVEVDRAGNIKAQGENVSKVLVDGKEFFGSDPKVATRNLPADAIKKVQVFDRKSDAAEFTGIDDGSREKTINLNLKEDKKKGYFGDVLAGGGTNERYKASAKLYRFRPKSQFAALGMFNNINRSGFSFSDYINFSGGLSGMMTGNGSFSMNLDNSAPVDFGQTVDGIVTSGAGGINYSYEFKKNKSISISYLGNGANKKLNQTTHSRNFTNDRDYTTDSKQNQTTEEIAHRLNLTVRNDLDSQSQIMLNASANTSQSNYNANSNAASVENDITFNDQSGTQQELGNAVNGTAGLSFTNKSLNKKNVLRLSANGNYKRSLNENEWNNTTRFLGGAQTIVNNQYRNDKIQDYDYGGTVSYTRSLGNGFYLNPALAIKSDVQQLNRRQGLQPNETSVIDTLSPDFNRTYNTVSPGLTFRKGAKKIQYSTTIKYEYGILEQNLNGTSTPSRQYGFLLPSFSWRNQYDRGKHIDMRYYTDVQAPSYQQLMEAPVVSSPLSFYIGNAALRPEYRHNAHVSWMLYDAFSFTSFYTSLSGRYTHNKLSSSVFINNNLGQTRTTVNVPDDYNLSYNAQFSRPVRSLGIKTELHFSEEFNKGITVVNAVNNGTTSFTHNLTAKIGNRKKEKWDAEIGGGVSITDVKYSIQKSMNNVYMNISAFSEISYRPTDKWYFMVSGDMTRYTARSFPGAVVVPLVRSEVSYYFMKANRAVLTLEGFDILNQNKGIQRTSQQNYLAETRSNIIGRYFMLSFKYRLSKTGKKSMMMLDDIDINIKH